MWLTNIGRFLKGDGRTLKMTVMGDIPRELVALFEPQVEQLGVRFRGYGLDVALRACAALPRALSRRHSA